MWPWFSCGLDRMDAAGVFESSQQPERQISTVVDKSARARVKARRGTPQEAASLD